jgi:DNA-binding winged helix-turn-helix (wHTH) protein/pimeloyl-ACP methyl ester carboxylesterase
VLDPQRRELRSGSGLVAIEPRVFDLLEFLIRHRDRVCSRDDLVAAVWHGRIVSESAIAARINAARRAVGDSGEQQRWIRTVARRGFRFVGDVAEETAAHAHNTPAATPTPQSSADPARSQAIQFCRTKDGINIALASVGTGPPLVALPTWLSDLAHDWQSPIRAPLWRFLADRVRLISYDGRGFGYSDREVAEISSSTFALDLEAVVDALDLHDYTLLGLSQAASTAITHAAAHPERVSKIILVGSFARGRNKRGSANDEEIAKMLLATLRRGFGEENAPLLRFFITLIFPSATNEQIRWYANLLRQSSSVENAIRSRIAVNDLDVVELLPKVRTPTLVLHSCRDTSVPFEGARHIAASIAHARFVSLESENNVPLPGEPAWSTMLGAIEAFLRE